MRRYLSPSTLPHPSKKTLSYEIAKLGFTAHQNTCSLISIYLVGQEVKTTLEQSSSVF